MLIAWLLIPAGLLMVVYTEKVEQFTGEIGFAEKHIGAGGTFTFIKLFGLAMSILAFMWVTGGIQPILQSTLGRFFASPV